MLPSLSVVRIQLVFFFFNNQDFFLLFRHLERVEGVESDVKLLVGSVFR